MKQDILKFIKSRVKKRKIYMNCCNCGGKLKNIITDLPFKVDKGAIVIIKKLPILQCQNCNEYLIDDSVMKKIDSIINKTDKTVELEILKYAA